MSRERFPYPLVKYATPTSRRRYIETRDEGSCLACPRHSFLLDCDLKRLRSVGAQQCHSTSRASIQHPGHRGSRTGAREQGVSDVQGEVPVPLGEVRDAHFSAAIGIDEQATFVRDVLGAVSSESVLELVCAESLDDIEIPDSLR